MALAGLRSRWAARRVVRAPRRGAAAAAAAASRSSQGRVLEAPSGAAYDVLGERGEGGFGVTLLATRRPPPGEGGEAEPVLVKELSLRRIGQWKALELFEREAATLRALDHPAIPSYVEHWETDTETDRGFYLAQRRAPGESLEELVSSGWRPTDAVAEDVARQLLGVLAYLQALRPPVLHRDIKPANVLYDRSTGKVSLVDFGAVASAGGGDGGGSTVVGTFGYMAPEAVTGSATAQSDLYSVGGTLLFLVSGRAPGSFPQSRLRVDFSSVTVGPALARLLAGLLEAFPEDRPGTPDDAVALLEGRGRAPATAGAAGGAAGGRLWKKPARGAPGVLAGGDDDDDDDDDAEMDDDVLPAPVAVTRRARKPKGTRVLVERTDTSLRVLVPPAGVTGSSVGTGAFAVAWNSFVLFWTVSAFAGGGILVAAFSLPFWFAGYQVALDTVLAVAQRTELQVTPSRFSLDTSVRGRSLGSVEGATADLGRPEIATAAVVNGEPRRVIEITEGVETLRFGQGLTVTELEWVAGELNDFLERFEQRR